MKKMLKRSVFLFGAVALLASCGGGGGSRPVERSLALHEIGTNHVLSSDFVAPNGKKLKAGTPYLCENQRNRVFFNVSWKNMSSGDRLLIYVNGLANKANGHGSTEKYVGSASFDFANGHQEFEATIDANRDSHPFSVVEVQSLVPTPKFDLVGINTFELKVNDNLQIKSEQQVPIFNCG